MKIKHRKKRGGFFMKKLLTILGSLVCEPLPNHILCARTN